MLFGVVFKLFFIGAVVAAPVFDPREFLCMLFTFGFGIDMFPQNPTLPLLFQTALPLPQSRSRLPLSNQPRRILLQFLSRLQMTMIHGLRLSQAHQFRNHLLNRLLLHLLPPTIQIKEIPGLRPRLLRLMPPHLSCPSLLHRFRASPRAL